MLKSIRKHSKVITFIFAIIMVCFIGQEISLYFLKKNEDNENLGAVMIFDGVEIKYYEYKNRLNRLQQIFRENNQSENSVLFSMYKKKIIDEMILERGCAKIAKNLHFVISRDEALSLYKNSNNEFFSYMQKQGKDIEKVRENFDKQMAEIIESSVLSSYFTDSEQERNDYRNQVKIQNLVKNLSSYPVWKAERDFNIENSFADIDYFYVLQNANDDIVISDEEYQQYIDNDVFYKYNEAEKYKIKYIKVNYPLSEDDIQKNKNSLEKYSSNFSKIKENEQIFAKTHSDSFPSKKRLDNLLILSENDLPEVVKSSLKKDVGDVFIKIAKDSDDFNAVYKIVKIEEDKNGSDNAKKYHIAVIYKVPIVCDKTKTEFFSSLKEKVADIKNSEQIELFAKNNKYTLEEKVVFPDAESVIDFENSRKMVVDINKKCRSIFGKDLYIIEARKQKTNCIFGIVSEHVKERMRVNDYQKKILEHEIKGKAKNKALFDMMREKGILELSFEELDKKLEDKDFDFLKKGSARVKLSQCNIEGFGPVDFSVISLLKEGSQTPFFETPKGIIKVLIKGITCEKKNKNEFDKFYSKKNKSHKMSSLENLFKKVFEVKVLLNEVV